MTTTSQQFDIPWVEKHRPTSLSSIIGNQSIISSLMNISQEGNLPNLILSGPPGTGKTTSIMVLAHELLGQSFKKATIEVLQLYPSIKKQVNKYREWIYSLVLSIFLELEIEDPKVLSSLFLNIIDGLIIDGTINKPEINSEETWSYINKLIELETKQKYEAA